MAVPRCHLWVLSLSLNPRVMCSSLCLGTDSPGNSQYGTRALRLDSTFLQMTEVSLFQAEPAQAQITEHGLNKAPCVSSARHTASRTQMPSPTQVFLQSVPQIIGL